LNKKTFSFRSVLLMLLIIALIPALGFAHDAAAAQAKTSPPPSSFLAPNTIFHPDFDFLEKGQGYLSYQGDNKVNIWGETYGTVRVNEIGIQVTLQRWTGSTWTDVYIGASVKERNAAYAYTSVRDISVLSGYYYRVKAYHWIRKDNTTESGYRYSSSYLIPE
jgi:hypothetical protein